MSVNRRNSLKILSCRINVCFTRIPFSLNSAEYCRVQFLLLKRNEIENSKIISSRGMSRFLMCVCECFHGGNDKISYEKECWNLQEKWKWMTENEAQRMEFEGWILIKHWVSSCKCYVTWNVNGNSELKNIQILIKI